MHWAEEYVGLAISDCAALCERVLSERFGRVVALPSERGGPFADTALVDQHRDDLAERTDAPIDGDGVLMKSRGRLAHIGLYVAIGGVPHVLHAMPVGVCLHKLRELPKLHMHVEGFYRWR